MNENSHYCTEIDGSVPSSSHTHTADLTNVRGGNGDYDELDPSVAASSFFHTPLTTRTTPTQTPKYHEAYCAAHTPTRKNSNSDPGHTRADADMEADLHKARTEQSEGNKASRWPAMLQKVVVGEVTESVIAKRRRSTLGRSV